MKLRLVKKFNVGACEKYASRVFCSVLPSEDGFVGVVREYDPAEGDKRTDVRLLRFDHCGFIRADEWLAEGEDPRLFKWGDELFVLTWMETGRGDWHLWLVDVRSKAKVQLRIEPWMFHGKNWVPLVMNEELYLLRSLDPLVVLSVDRVTGICNCIHGAESQIAIGQYRGGAAAEFDGKVITGFGHRTHHAELHTVFRYVIEPGSWSIRTEEVELAGVEGMGIIDPTSSWPGYLAVCATPSFWWQWQPVIHALLRIESD